MVSQTHRQLTGAEDSSKCGGGVVTAAAWWQPAGSNAAMLADGPTPALEAIMFPLLMGKNLQRRRRRRSKTFRPDGHVLSLSNSEVMQQKVEEKTERKKKRL